MNRRTLPAIATAIAIAALLASGAQAAIKTETVTYTSGSMTLKGYLAYDDATTAKRPGVLLIHEWWGLNDYARHRAEMLAKEGYVAFAADMFGDGKSTNHPQVAGEFASAASKDPEAALARFRAGLDQLKANSRTDGSKVAAIGYCFGGRTVLGAAMNGIDLAGVVSFHGSLPQAPAAPGTVKAKMLVLHGAADAFIPADQVATFQKNLAEAGADLQFVSYSGAKHGFSNPDAGSYGLDGLAYDKAADQRSWKAMQSFFAEIFGK